MSVVEVQTSAGRTGKLSDAAVEALAGRLRGRLIRAGGDEYAGACRLWNGMIHRQPALIARCTGPADVRTCVAFARDRDVRLSVRAGGHNVSGAALVDGGLVIDLSALRGVRPEPDRHRVRVAGGARLGDLDHETLGLGQAVPTGVVSATGVAGLTLHGGYGWLARRWGLAADNVESLDVVTADGQFRVVDAQHDPDLFWALRGGGGNFGVVTSFEFRTHDLDHDVWMALVMYPAERTLEAMQFYRQHMQHAPDELAALCVLWSAPDVEPVPPAMRGQPVVVFLACYSGPPDAGREMIRPFCTFGESVADLSARMPFDQAQQMLDEDYPDGRCYYWKSIYLPALDEPTMSLLREAAAARPSPLTSVDVWAGGGAVARVAPDATPIANRAAPFMVAIEANWPDPADADDNIAWARDLFKALRELTGGATYLNFPGFVEEGTDLLRGAYGENYDRLIAVKRRYDPDDLFRGKLSVAVNA